MSANEAERFQELLDELAAGRISADELATPSLKMDKTEAEALRRDVLVVEALAQLARPAASPQAVQRMSQAWRAAAQQATPAPRPSVRPRFDAWRRAAAVLAFTLLAALGSGGGIVAASADALPHEVLYGIKRAWEGLIVWVVSLAGRASEALIHLAETRYDELTRLLALGLATPQALDDFALAYEQASSLGDSPRLLALRNAATLGLAQLPETLRASENYEVLRAWLSLPAAPPLSVPQAAPQATASPTPLPTSPPPDPALALSQTQAALQAQLEQTTQALALTQTALASFSSPTPSPTLRFAPTATRTPEFSPTPTSQPSPTPQPSPTSQPSPTWTPLALPSRPLLSSTPSPQPAAPIVWSPTPAQGDAESPFIRLTIQAAQLTQTAQAAATEESSAP